ncbi:MAG TPA: hypothetical protein PK675_00335 [Clostridia bacterium]|nr:hypothetical protein [Clostridia bacterium]
MILYLTIIGGGLLLIFVANTIVSVSGGAFTVWYALFQTLLYFVCVFAIDIVVSLAVRYAPSKLYEPDRKIYKVGEREKRFYNFIKIKEWKDKIPELGKMANFDKKKIEKLEAEYLYKFAKETVYAEIMHVGMAIFGWAILFIPGNATIFNFAFPIALVNFLLQIPPILTQRYNRPKLLKAYAFMSKKSLSAETVSNA